MANTIELRTLGAVIKETYEDNPDTNAYTDAEKAKLSGIDDQATKNSKDEDLLDRSKHTGTQPMTTVTGLLDEFDTKVDKVTGKTLTDNNFTDDEKNKLSGLEGPHFKGTYQSLTALENAVIEAVAGDYADVDGGAGQETFRCIWDVSNEQWVPQLGESTDVTGAQVKSLYESQPDTNAFTDDEKEKLAGIAVEATKNSTDAALLSRDNHTGTQAITTVTGLQTALDGKLNIEDGKVLSDNNYTNAEKDKLAGIISSGSGNFTWRYKGVWNPLTNSPLLIDGTGTQGDYYIATSSGDRSFGSITYNFIQYDLVLFAGGTWRRISVNPNNYKPRGNISPPIPALYGAAPNGVNVTRGALVKLACVPVYDTFSLWNSSNNRFVVPSWASHIRLSLNVTYNISEHSKYFSAYILKNGSTHHFVYSQASEVVSPSVNCLTGIIPTVAGDYYEIGTYQLFDGTSPLLNGRTTLNIELFESI